MNEVKILTKRDLMENILIRTKELGIDKLIHEFVTLDKSSYDHVFSLYFCIEKLASPMLAEVPKEMKSREVLYKAIKQVLYVAGEWTALADFYFIMNFRDLTSNKFTVTTVCETETNFIRKYVQNNRIVTITLTDSLYAVLCDVTTLYIERMNCHDSITTN